MKKDFLRFLLRTTILPAVAFSLTCTGITAASEPAPGSFDEAFHLLERGLEYYRAGEYTSALESFEELAARRPHWRVMMELRRRVELGTLTGIITDAVIRERPPEQRRAAESAAAILRMMSEAHRYKMLDIEDIEGVIRDFSIGDHEEYLHARTTLIAHGAYSVPHLLELLALRGQEHASILARAMTTLRDIGRPATLPLVVALRTDDQVLKSRIAASLEKLGDIRALPALLAVAERPDTTSETQQAVWKAIESIQQRTIAPAPLHSATEEYVKLSALYMKEDASRLGHVLGDYAVIWRWDPEGETVSRRLAAGFAMTHAYYQAQGAQIALQGLSVDPGNLRLQGLLIGMLSRELAHLERYGNEGDVEEYRQYADRRQALLKPAFNRIANLYGTDAMGKALGAVLETIDAEAAIRIANALSGRAVPGRSSGQALCEALGAEHHGLRFHAALAILRSSPEGDICSPEKTVQVLRNILTYDRETERLPDRKNLLRQTVETIAQEAAAVENYPVSELEPVFLSALEQYLDDDEIRTFTIECLEFFGTADALAPLIDIAADENSPDILRARSCMAIARIAAERKEHDLTDSIADALYAALRSDVPAVQHAAASALNSLGICLEAVLELTGKEILRAALLAEEEILKRKDAPYVEETEEEPYVEEMREEPYVEEPDDDSEEEDNDDFFVF